jgi:hypothetical protein
LGLGGEESCDGDGVVTRDRGHDHAHWLDYLLRWWPGGLGNPALGERRGFRCTFLSKMKQNPRLTLARSIHTLPKLKRASSYLTKHPLISGSDSTYYGVLPHC